MKFESPYTAKEIYEVLMLVSSCSDAKLILTQRQMEILNKMSGLKVNDAIDILYPLFKIEEGVTLKDELKTEGE